ncbi:hypothetical protein [Alcanivorax sp.]|jgi:hypothetical protein|uniref:hypothetical protein n=1 Tax=Alcanivorax sp. TaxID=1872427 RepID=UPI002B26A647|nr:hypothetical protein [Alcanivorax sp.]
MRLLLAMTVSLAALGLAACGGDDDNDPPPRAQATVDYTVFVKTQLAATSDTTDPVNVNNVRFRNQTDSNEDAYNSVLD